MVLIAAVYDDWGIGADGTQPIALKADRKFFRETTRGAAVIAGRRTVADFPGQKPLPGRLNIVLTRKGGELPGFTLCGSIAEVLALTKDMENVMVIGGGSVYAQLLPYCDGAYITKVHTTPRSDTYLPNLDADPQWQLAQILQSREEEGIPYEMCYYRRA